MTDEQGETIERLNRFKTIEILYGNTFAMHIEQLKTVQRDIETVLSMLQEQQNKIKRLECTLAENHARELNNSIYKSNKSKEDLEMLNAGWQIELEKKDKIIDLMARAIDNYDCQLVINTFKDTENIKQYFERKAEDVKN